MAPRAKKRPKRPEKAQMRPKTESVMNCKVVRHRHFSGIGCGQKWSPRSFEVGRGLGRFSAESPEGQNGPKRL